MADADDILGLTDTTDVADQIPADVYSQVILEGLYANRMLADIVSAVREDLSGRAGNIVQVPFIAARTAQGPITAGNALTATDESTGTYPITLAKYGDYDLVQREVFEDQMNFNEADFVRNQFEALAEKVDQLVYDELETATPGATCTLATTADVSLSDFYDCVVEVRASLQKLKVRPSHLIIGPDQAAQLLKDTSEGIKEQQITVRDGMVLRVAGLDTITTPLANAAVSTLSEVQGIVIDSQRAVGEAWGRRPEFKRDDVSKIESDQVKLVTWIRYGTSELDTNAIGHVINPTS